jgi:hypothetical protein
VGPFGFSRSTRHRPVTDALCRMKIGLVEGTLLERCILRHFPSTKRDSSSIDQSPAILGVYISAVPLLSGLLVDLLFISWAYIYIYIAR